MVDSPRVKCRGSSTVAERDHGCLLLAASFFRMQSICVLDEFMMYLHAAQNKCFANAN